MIDTPFTKARAGSSVKYLDLDLRHFMLRVYNYLASGIALSAILAYALGAPLRALYETGGTMGDVSTTIDGKLATTLMLANVGQYIFIGCFFVMLFKRNFSATGSKVLFWTICTSQGLALSALFGMYSSHIIALALATTSALFASLSLYGYTTKRDLTPIGSFAFMGLIALIIVSVVGIFVHSTFLEAVFTYGGLLIFSALIAFRTQYLKDVYHSLPETGEYASKAATMGALGLYIDFLNLFLIILRILGSRD